MSVIIGNFAGFKTPHAQKCCISGAPKFPLEFFGFSAKFVIPKTR